MTYLLDTSTFLWAASDPGKLSPKARRVCASGAAQRLVSVASLWEIAIKCSIGKLEILNPAAALPSWILNLDARVLSVELCMLTRCIAFHCCVSTLRSHAGRAGGSRKSGARDQ